MRYKFEGTIKLPTDVLLAEDALGQTFSGAVDIGKFALVMPHLPDDPGDAPVFLLGPTLKGDLSTDVPQWGYTGFGKVTGYPQTFASWIEHVAIRVDVETDYDDYVVCATNFGSSFNKWYTLAIQWIELWAGQVLTAERASYPPTRGNIWEVTEERPRLTGWGAHVGSIHVHPSTAAATKHVIEAAFANATNNIAPPVQWILLHQAERRMDNRVAVIDLASAAEVCLAAVINSRCSNLTERARERIVRQANGLIGLLQFIEALDDVSGKESAWSRVAARIANPRNDAAHGARVPTSETVRVAIDECRKLLTEHTPLPNPLSSSS